MVGGMLALKHENLKLTHQSALTHKYCQVGVTEKGINLLFLLWHSLNKEKYGEKMPPSRLLSDTDAGRLIFRSQNLEGYEYTVEQSINNFFPQMCKFFLGFVLSL